MTYSASFSGYVEPEILEKDEQEHIEAAALEILRDAAQKLRALHGNHVTASAYFSSAGGNINLLEGSGN